MKNISIYCAQKQTERNLERSEEDEEQVDHPQVQHVKKRRLLLNLAMSPEARHILSQKSTSISTDSNTTEHDYATIDNHDANTEFSLAFARWQEWHPDWKRLYPNQKFDTFDVMDELKDLDMKILMRDALLVRKSDNDCFGLLPHMASVSKFQLGPLLSQSFAEQLNSAGKNIVRDNRGKLDHEMIDKLVVLRMNRNFMEFCRKFQVKNKLKLNRK